MNVEKPELVNALAVALSDAVVLSHKVQGAHWNVMGPDFPEFHEFFSEIYEDIDGSIDPFAENIRKLGAVSPYRLFEFARMSNIEDTDVGYRELDLAKDILIYNAVMLNDLKKAFDIANQANEQGIANFIAERIDMHAKWDWQLKATTYQGI
jgi:starvation-inducible DNA-binding protein